MLQRAVRYQAAILRDDHILLLKVFDRSDGREIWIIPGGGQEGGESEEACVRREVREETHLDVVVGPLLLETPVHGHESYQVLKTYRCTIISGEARPGTEPELDHDGQASIRAVGWFDLRDPAGWDPAVAAAKATLPLLHELCAVLGYTTRVTAND
jgi:8-oxo-dGTP diphosphatase